MRSYRDRCGTSLSDLLAEAKPMDPASYTKRTKTRPLARWQVLERVRKGCPHCHTSLSFRFGKAAVKKDGRPGTYWSCANNECPARDDERGEYYYVGFHGERVGLGKGR